MKRLTLNAEKILKKEFNREIKGYNAEEVDMILDSIIKDYEIMEIIINEYKEEINRLENELVKTGSEYKELEIKNQIVQSQMEELKKKGYQQLDIIERVSEIENKINSKLFQNIEKQNKEIIALLKDKK